MTDHDLITALRQNNYSRAVKGLYRHYAPVQKYILANNGSRGEAEDVFQDALVILHQKINNPQFVLQSALQTYLTAIAKNLWLHELRRKKKWLPGQLPDAAGETMHSDAEEYVRAKTAFEKLGDACRELLTLFYHAQKSYTDIAVELGYSDAATAKNQKYRCLQKAKEFYLKLTKNPSHE
jgi:RNA polymerase sigma factor (sigma-70 family)